MYGEYACIRDFLLMNAREFFSGDFISRIFIFKTINKIFKWTVALSLIIYK